MYKIIKKDTETGQEFVLCEFIKSEEQAIIRALALNAFSQLKGHPYEYSVKEVDHSKTDKPMNIGSR